MRFLIGLLVIIFGLLYTLNEQIATFEAPRVSVVPPVSVPLSAPPSVTSDIAPIPEGSAPAVAAGNYSMADKFRLFLSLGASSPEAVLLTAICTAENGSGSPTAIGHNRSAPDDVGLCQINASHVPALAPSYQSLEDPVTNATVALRMLRSGGPKQWCTYPGGCGGLPGVPNFANLLVQSQSIAGDR